MSRMYRFAIIAGVLSLLVVFTVLIMGTLNSGEVNAQAKCSLQTLNGTYLFEGRGVFIDGEGKDATMISYAEAGFQNFDGEGNFDGFYSSTLNGEPLDSQQYFTGTYELNSGCVFTNYAPVGDGVLVVHMYTNPKGTYMTYLGPGASGTAVKP